MSHRANTTKELIIYLVDDEALLLDMAEFALLPDGYKLRRFQDPKEALAAFTTAEKKPALLLTDYAMDSMNGVELSEKCKARHPDLKILLVSGTVGAEVATQFPGTVDHFMPKPYSPAELAHTVRALLGASAV